MRIKTFIKKINSKMILIQT